MEKIMRQVYQIVMAWKTLGADEKSTNPFCLKCEPWEEF